MSGSPDNAEARAEEAGEADEGAEGALLDMPALVARGDVEGLLVLARAYRAGTGGQARDLHKCFDCYREAASLGSAEAEYAVALFYLSGGVVQEDLKEGAARLRKAADGGYLPAKVYLANLYELGVHFAADPAKADVWYRSAARGANITSDPASREYAVAMADLGCARQCLALAEDAATSEEDRQRFLKKARAYGYQLVVKRESRTPAPPESQLSGPEALKDDATGDAPSKDAAAKDAAAKGAAAKGAAENEEASAPRAKSAPRPATLGPALTAFFIEALFVAASLGAAYLVSLGLPELAQRGIAPAILVAHARAVLPAVFVVFGVLPAFLTYRAGAVMKAALAGGLLAGASYFLWGSPLLTLLHDRDVQAVGAGAVGFLAALLVLGMAGGVKPRRPRTPSMFR